MQGNIDTHEVGECVFISWSSTCHWKVTTIQPQGITYFLKEEHTSQGPTEWPTSFVPTEKVMTQFQDKINKNFLNMAKHKKYPCMRKYIVKQALKQV